MCSLERRGRVFVMRLAGEGEHRLSPALFDSILSAIAQVQQHSDGASALVTCNEGKFFSNGLDLQWAMQAEDWKSRRTFLVNKMEEVAAALLSLRMPTIAAVCGHASAGGFMLALAHDYRFMRGDRGFLYMNELDLGLNMPPKLMALIRSKVPSPAVLRDVILCARKFTGHMALGAGLVDSVLPNSQETLEAALRSGEELAARNWEGEAYFNMRIASFPHAAHSLGVHPIS